MTVTVTLLSKKQILFENVTDFRFYEGFLHLIFDDLSEKYIKKDLIAEMYISPEETEEI